jgi:hypothetical protein
MCLENPVKVSVLQQITAWKAFWYKDGEYFPVIFAELRGENLCVNCISERKAISLKAYISCDIQNFPEVTDNDLHLFHAILPPSYDVEYIPGIMTKSVLLYMRGLGWWQPLGPRAPERLTQILEAGYQPVVAQVQLSGDLYTSATTSQVGGTQMTILSHTQVQL